MWGTLRYRKSRVEDGDADGCAGGDGGYVAAAADLHQGKGRQETEHRQPAATTAAGEEDNREAGQGQYIYRYTIYYRRLRRKRSGGHGSMMQVTIRTQ